MNSKRENNQINEKTLVKKRLETKALEIFNSLEITSEVRIREVITRDADEEGILII